MSIFSLSMSISPGPVNLITLSTGVNHGFRSAMPFVSGATIGFTLLLIFIGLGLGQFAEEGNLIMNIIGYGGTGFICYMGYKLATAPATMEIIKQERPSFIQGFLLQWLNPKAWIACFAGVSAFKLGDSTTLLALFVGLYFLICYASIASWALVGTKIESLLSTPKNLMIFNRVMGGLLIMIAIYLLIIQQLTM